MKYWCVKHVHKWAIDFRTYILGVSEEAVRAECHRRGYIVHWIRPADWLTIRRS